MSSPKSNRPNPIQNVTGRRSIHSRASPSPSSPKPRTPPQRSNPNSDDELDSPEPSNLNVSKNRSSSKVTLERTRSPQRQYEKVQITVKRKEKTYNVRGNSSPIARSESLNESDVYHTPGKETSPRSINRTRSQVERMSRHPSRSVSPKERFHYNPENADIENSSNMTPTTMLLLFLISLIICVVYSVSGTGSTNEPQARRYCNDFERLKKTFPHQNEYIWKALKTGIEGVINNRPPKPSIFLFLHRDENSTRNIIEDIVNAAATCFDNKHKAVTLTSTEFMSNDAQTDQGVFIERYREAMKSGGVVLIADLDKMSPHAAKALHFICDNENPIINNVVIFLTLKSLSNDDRPIEVAEDTLNTIWNSKIDANTLSAIVTRITDQVLPLYPE